MASPSGSKGKIPSEPFPRDWKVFSLQAAQAMWCLYSPMLIMWEMNPQASSTSPRLCHRLVFWKCKGLLKDYQRARIQNILGYPSLDQSTSFLFFPSVTKKIPLVTQKMDLGGLAVIPWPWKAELQPGWALQA